MVRFLKFSALSVSFILASVSPSRSIGRECKIDLNEPNYIAHVQYADYQRAILPAIRRVVRAHSSGTSYNAKFSDFWTLSGLQLLTGDFPFKCCDKCPVKNCGADFEMVKINTADADFTWSSGTGQVEPFNGVVAGRELEVAGELPASLKGRAEISADSVRLKFGNGSYPYLKATDLNFENTGASKTTVDYPVFCIGSSSQYAFLLPLERGYELPNLPIVIVPVKK